ncbi:MAG: hypothetical protein IJC80_00150 [Clostridia bacterium]|nr:hypothetical protein [Clostridia bacterium]
MLYCEGCVKETNDEETKLIIDKLYTLRAILSKASIEIEKMHNVGDALVRCKKEIFEFLEFYNDFYTRYLLPFKEIINENDWKNIDLIIYMLETKKALTQNEALQQIGLYRDTGKMTSIAVIATKNICNTITYEPTKIENAISSSICTINKGQNSYFKNSVVTLELKNAMMERYNATSGELAQQIDWIKQIASLQME